MSDSLAAPMEPTRPYDVLAGLLIALAFGIGIGLTATLDWPVGPDLYRDIAGAETTKSGGILADPFYAGEWIWYNPLVPSLVAGLAVMTHVPVHIVETRAGPYLNVFAAASFYWLLTILAPRRAAVAGLGAFLFLQPFPSWEAATYSPWLFVSNFAQTLFYTTLGVWIRDQKRVARPRPLLLGVLLGLTFLAHTAPAALLGVFILIGCGRRHMIARSSWREVVVEAAAVFGVACVVAAPFLYSILWHYRGRVVNPLPIFWLDPAMLPSALGGFLYVTLGPSFVNVVAAAGLLYILRPPSLTRFVIAVWALASAALFAYSAYAWRVFDSPVLQRLTLVPAHHFLVYFRATIAVLFGIGFEAALSRTGALVKSIRNQQWNAPGDIVVTAGSLAVILAVHFPAYLRRDDNAAYVRQAAGAFADTNQRVVFDWIATRSPRDAVFLAPENASLSMIAPAGRKVVIVERFFSNPYVDWSRRHEASRAMWASLASGDCRDFGVYARLLHVTHVLALRGATPEVAGGQCGLEVALTAGDFTILRWTGAAKP